MNSVPEDVKKSYGQLPKSWQLERMKFFAVVRNSNVDKKMSEYETLVRLCNYTDIYYNEMIDSSLNFMRGSATEAEIEKFQLRAGQVILTKDSEDWKDIGVPAVISEDMSNVVCGYHLAVIDPMSELHGSYLGWLCRSDPLNDQFKLGANGVTRFGLGQYSLMNAFIPVPPIDAQHGIARFLDKKTARIDALIEKKRALLKRLAEKRQALITRAVTKGLDPDVPMKDSGIEWLGQIPAHWEALQIRRLLATPLSNGIFKKKAEYGDGKLLVNVFDVYRDDLAIDFSTLDRVRCGDDEASTYSVQKGDIFFVRSSLKREGVAVAAIADKVPETSVFECHLVRARCKSLQMRPKFLSFVLASRAYRDRLVALAKTTTMTTIEQESLHSTQVPVPPVMEQDTIVCFLEQKIRDIRSLQYKIDASITYLAEYRSALITAAVIGQLDIPKSADTGSSADVAEATLGTEVS